MSTILLNPAPNMPRADYPRPQWVRETWYCLNGADVEQEQNEYGSGSNRIIKKDFFTNKTPGS